MKKLQPNSRVEPFSVALSAFLLTTLVLFSCTKNLADATATLNPQLTAANGSSQSSKRNSIVAVPFENTFYVPCANGGAGESVALSGKTNFVYQIAWNDHSFTIIYHDNTHEVTGVGLSTGETFVGSGGTEGVAMGSWVNNQWVATMVRQMKIIGRNTVLTMNYKLHLIITSDGNVTVDIREQTVNCK